MTCTIAVPHRWQPTMFLGDEVVEWTCAANPTERLAHSWHGEGEPPEGTCYTIEVRSPYWHGLPGTKNIALLREDLLNETPPHRD